MHRRTVLASGTVGLLTATAGCLGLGSDSSERNDGTSSDTGETPTATPTDTETATATDEGTDTADNRDWSRQWHHATPAAIEAIVRGRVVGTATDESNRLIALDADTGARRWTYQRESGWYYVYPGFSIDDAIYFGQTTDEIAGDGAVYAVEFDGDECWRIETRGVRSLAVTDTHIYAGLESTAVQAITKETGTQRWQYDLASTHDWDAPRAPQVAVGGGRVYAAGGELVALDPSGPEAAWTFGKEYGVLSIGAVDEETLVVDTGAGPAVVAGGEQRWLVEDGSDLLEVTADRVITESEDGTIRAFDRATGDEQWTSQPAAEPRSVTSTLGPETVYVGISDVLYALDLDSGNVAWQTQVATDSPVALRTESVASPAVYVATRPSRVQRLDTDGTASWSAYVPGEISQIIADEKVYVATPAGIGAFGP